MGFEAELRAYLEQLDHAARLGREHLHRRIDEHALRAYFLRRLRELEVASGGPVVEEKFRGWSRRIAPFAQYVSSLPLTMAPTDAAEAQVFSEAALEAAMGLAPTTQRGRVEQLELERIANEFHTTNSGENVERYAVETYLVRDEPGRSRGLTLLATAFLRLRGKDAIRWLLTSEVLQSTGHWDPWRTPRKLLERALEERGIMAAPDDQGYPMMPFDTSLLARLNDLGVLHAIGDDDDLVYEYRVADAWRDSLRTVLGTGPWHHAISAVLAEDRTGLVPTVQTATEGVVEQAKMIAHEIRNALVPARHQLDALRGVAQYLQAKRVDAARRGVVRVLAFVEELAATSELVTEPAVRCDLMALIREAIGWVDGGERISVVESAPVRVRAPRAQLARAIANVLRNSLQATHEMEAVRISIQQRAPAVHVVVDDAGPGVPEGDRERVFQEGYTTRTDGSGYGLAYVNRVVVDGLRGRVWCEVSDLGGARFVIELPEIEVER